MEKGERDDGTFRRSDCPRGTRLQQYLASWQSYLAPGARGLHEEDREDPLFRRP
jgi:hypothetical protein